MVLGALAALIELEPDMRVIDQVREGTRAFSAVVAKRPDILLADIEMPEMSGIELTEALRQRKIETKVIILTTFARPGYLQRALAAGASGYLLKESPSRDLAAAIRRVHAGEQVVNPRLAAEAIVDRDPLTDRERQILQLVEGGASSGEIAIMLRLSKGTVRNHLSQAITKLAANSRADAARIAKSKGWL